MDKVEEAINVIMSAPEKVREEPAIKKQLEELQNDLKLDNVLPRDDPEIIRFNKFTKWLTDGGAIYDKIKMRYYSKDYRGVHARTKIRKNEIFLYIPRNLIITLEMAKKAPIGSKMEKANVQLLSPKHSYLSSYVLQEKRKKDSKWEPYLDMLPKEMRSFPIFFTPEEKKWLEGSPFLDQVEERLSDMTKDYKNICTAVEEFSQFSFEEFAKTRMLISSRIFGINIHGGKTDGLVPLADMLNHKRPQQTSWEYSDKREGFIIESKENIERGEQVYDSYGKKCNSRFLINYGFIVENNDGNEVPIKITLDESDPLYNVKLKLLGGSTSKTIRVCDDLSERNMMHFFSFLRFVQYEGDPMTLYKFQFAQNAKRNDEDDDDANSFQGTNIPPISLSNEKSVLKRIMDQALIQLKKYPTTYEEDLKILENQKDKMSWNNRNCVLMRSGEKKILLYLIQLATLGLQLIDMPLKKARETFNKRDDRDKFDKYISVLLLFMQNSGKAL